MDDSKPMRSGARTSRAAPSVLTPPAGLPAMPGHEPVATQREATPVAGGAPTPPSARPEPIVDPCVCGHSRETHEHLRRGRDCGACGAQGCAAFRRPGGPVRRLLRRVGLVARRQDT
jgi:hypothetical protein